MYEICDMNSISISEPINFNEFIYKHCIGRASLAQLFKIKLD